MILPNRSGFLKVLAPSVLIVLLITSPVGVASSPGSKTFVPKITEVGPDSITVQTSRQGGLSVDGKADANIATYKITNFTDIEVNGLKGSIADLAPGMDVRVVIGLDPDVADSVVARNEGPPPAASPSPKAANGSGLQGSASGMTFYKPFNKITKDVVVEVSNDKITIAPMGGRAVSYQVTPLTEVRVNGAISDISQVSVGMTVTVSASGEGEAGTIFARDADP